MKKSTRIRQVDGWFHGYHVYLKPTPINIDDLRTNVDEMLKGWYSKNCPEALGEFPASDEELKDPEKLREAMELLNKRKKWMKDKEFRGSYLKTIAEYCMRFEKEPMPDGDDFWQSDQLEYSTVFEFWDFFCGNRPIP